MKRNFFAPGEPYPQLRRAFVYKHKPTQTPPHLSRQAARFSVIGPETPLDPQSWSFAQIGQLWMVMAVEAAQWDAIKATVSEAVRLRADVLSAALPGRSKNELSVTHGRPAPFSSA